MNLKKKIIFLLCLIFYIFTIEEQIPIGKKILVILDNMEMKSSYSLFFEILQEKGFFLDYKTADENIEINKFGEWLYDNLIIFTPEADELGGIELSKLLEFIDSGHNILSALSSNGKGDIIRELASECNIEIEPIGTSIIDHFYFNNSDEFGYHTLIAASEFLKNVTNIPIPKEPILFQGVGMDIEEDSILLLPLLTGYSSTYSSRITTPSIKEVQIAGNKIVLVTALQARNNARVIFSGSLELFSDKFLTSSIQINFPKTKIISKSSNKEWINNIIEWLFQGKGLLRVRDVQHYKKGENISSTTYTIKDWIEYYIEIDEWNGSKWIPFQASDVQLEFIMLNPYIRKTLKHNNKGKFSIQFQLPDVYGIFTFKVEYIKQGYGFLKSITRVPVRPFRHNQYERFIDSAYPYYASSFSMMIGLFIFSWFFLYHREKK
jgi:oligosaccharyltransferase complex subunit beta